MKFLKKYKWIVLGLTIVLSIQATSLGDKYFEIVKNIEIFTNVYKELNQNYVEDIDPSELMRTGIDAMVGSLDPFTNYISASQVERYRIATQGKYEGIGILVRYIDGLVTISEITEGGPANAAGMKVADQILAINGKSVQNKSNDEVNQIMQGAPGTDIRFDVKRPGVAKDMEIVVSRDEINIPNVPVYEIVDGDIAYVSLTTFTADAGTNVRNALIDLKKQQPDLKGIILDLRNNGGGLLREAITLSNLFVDKGNEIVSTRGKVKERDRSYAAKMDAYDTKTPLTILINDHSASASEIVSGVIQDYDRGVLLGQRSYGKGLVQNTQDVGYNSRVKLTTSKYYIPSGRCIQSVEYENGEPVDIADERRSKFMTKHGRIVLDGGGVSPDIKLKTNAPSEFITALQEQHILFNYVTEYMLGNPEIKDESSYQFTDYDAFIAYAKKEGFEFTSSSEKMMVELTEQLEKEGLQANTKSSVEAIESMIDQDKADDFEEYKTQIIKLIEDDVVTRSFFEKGKIKRQLTGDDEVSEAIKILRDQQKYKEILSLTK